MENFNKIVDIVLSFDIGIVEYEEERFFVVVNSLTQKVDNPEYLKIRRAAVTELLNIPQEHADLQIYRLKSTIAELMMATAEAPLSNTMHQFDFTCGIRDISLTYIGDHDYSVRVKVTESFQGELLTEIDARVYIIKQIEDAVSVARGLHIDRISRVVYDLQKDEGSEDLDIDEIIDRIKAEHDLWDKIKKVKPKNKSKNIFSPKNDFYAYLNPQGHRIFPKLIDIYKGQKPKALFAMLFALKELELLNSSALTSYKQLDLAMALTSTFETTVSHQITSINIRIFEDPAPDKNQDILNQIGKIKALL